MVQLANRDASRPAWSRTAWCGHQVMINVLIGVVALVIFGATFRAGTERGMDQLVTWEGYGRVLNAVAAVMTKERFGVGGYALSNCIHNELENRGFTSDPEITKRLGVTVPQNLRAPFLDQVLADMHRDLPNVSENCKLAVRGLGADDLGYVDFAKIAFSLFGLHVRAFYYLFFLIYGLTLFCALLERRNDRLGQIILIGTAALVYASCYYSDFLLLPEPSGSGNMLNPRFMPVLALIPGVHLLLILVDKAQLNWWRIAYARLNWWPIAIVTFQSMVILFAIHIRASAVWWLLTFILAAVWLFVLALREARRKGKAGRLTPYRAVAAQWPAVLPVLVIALGVKAVAWTLHPVYREGGWLQHHAMWHSIYYSLQFHPKYPEKYAAYHDGQGGDAMPIAAAMRYLKDHPEEDKPDIYLAGKSLKYSAMERLDRLAFFEFARRDPWFTFETFFIIKAKLILDDIVNQTRLEWSRATWEGHLFFILVIVLSAVLAARDRADMQRLSRLTAIFGVGALASLLIPFLTVVFVQVMTEEIMAIQLAACLLLSLALANIVRACTRYYVERTSQEGMAVTAE